MAISFSPRISWPELPPQVREWVEQQVGGRIVQWQSQHGGFSPGTADRLLTDQGQRLFCKAVSDGLNEGSAQLCRRELEVNRCLPPGLPIPRLRHGGELHDGWVVLLFDDIDGRHPHTPWRSDELRSALTAIAQVSRVVPQASPELPRAENLLGPDFDHWPAIAAGPPVGLDPWITERLVMLTRRAANGREAMAGEALCQLDARADNMVLDCEGAVWLVDWPYACRGAAWLDAALLGVTVTHHGYSSELVTQMDEAVIAAGGSIDQVTDVWAGMLGYYVWVSEQPAPENLPTIRQFQARARDGLLAALQHRLPDPH